MNIRLRNIPVYAFHGAFPHEQEFGARFELDVEFQVPVSVAGQDSLADTIDYVAVHRYLREHAEGKHYNLLEAWALSLATELLTEFSISEAVIVRIRKPGAAIGGLIETVEVEHIATRACS